MFNLYGRRSFGKNVIIMLLILETETIMTILQISRATVIPDLGQGLEIYRKHHQYF
jgi:hypothetical protein